MGTTITSCFAAGSGDGTGPEGKVTKLVLSAQGIESPRGRLITPRDLPEIRAGDTSLNVPLPAIVKPNHEGSSKGISDDSVVRDSKALLQVKLLNCDLLLFRRHGAFFENSGEASGRDAEQAYKNPDKNDSSGACSENLMEKHAAEDGRHQRTERCAQAKRNGHPEGQAKEAHGQTERQTADTPQKAEKECPEQRAGRCL